MSAAAPAWYNKMESERAHSSKGVSYCEAHFLLHNVMKVLMKKGFDTVDGIPRDMWFLETSKKIAIRPLLAVFYDIFRVLYDNNLSLNVLSADPVFLMECLEEGGDVMKYYDVYPEIKINPTETAPRPMQTQTALDRQQERKKRGRKATPTPA